MYDVIATVSKQRIIAILHGAPSSDSVDGILTHLSHYLSTDVLVQLLFVCITDIVNVEPRLPDTSILLPWFSSLFALPSNDSSHLTVQLRTTLQSAECSFFLHHLVQIVMDYPSSLQFFSLHGTDYPAPVSLASYHASLRAVLQPAKPTDEIMAFYVNLVRVCDALSIAPSLQQALLQPVQQFLRTRPDWVQCVFLVMSRDVPVAAARRADL